MQKSSVSNRGFIRAWTALMAGSLILASAQCAQAGNRDGLNFRDFRQQNEGLSRHAARQQFRNELRESRAGRELRVQPTLPSVSIEQHNAILGNSDSRAGLVERVNHNQSLRQTRNRSMQLNDAGNVVKLKGGIDLDLTSSLRNISLGKNLFDGINSVEIRSGAETRTVSTGSHVTAAEYIAVKQILSGGEQKLSVDRSGRASGGEVNLDAITDNRDVMRASNLVVSNNVTTIGDFSRRSDFRLLGDLSNYGTVQALSTNTNVRSGAIRANDINNFKDATITSSLDLTLDASGNLNNKGLIVSTSGLSLAADGAINNSGTISSANDLNVSAPTVKNEGLIRSNSANINFDSAPNTALTINNQRGTISTTTGAINIRPSTYAGNNKANISGGNLLSRELNLHSGLGEVNVASNQITGVVNQTGTASHVLANTDNLKLGTICLTGDPTYYNVAGNIEITGDITVGEPLTIIASGDIFSDNPVTIRASNLIDSGSPITLIAGASFTTPFGGGSVGQVGGSKVLPSSGGVSLTGKASKTGGFINLEESTIVSRVDAPPVDSDGGDVMLVAFGNSRDSEKGTIRLGGALIDTRATGTGTAGNVTIIAGSTSGKSSIGAIQSNGTAGGSGFIQITNATPASTIRNQPVVFDEFGALVGTTTFGPTRQIAKATIRLTDSINGGFVLISGGESVTADFGKTVVADTTVLGAKFVGLDSNPLSVNTSNLSVLAGDSMFFDLANDAQPITFNQLQAKNEITFFGAKANVISTNNVSADTIFIRVNSFINLDNLTGKSSISLQTQQGLNGTNIGSNISAPELILSSAVGDVGTLSDPVELSGKLKQVVAVANSGNVYLLNNQAKGITFRTLFGDNINVVSKQSAVFGQVTAGVKFVGQSDSKNLTVQENGFIRAVKKVSLIASDIKGKIAIGKNSEVTVSAGDLFDNNILLTVGPVTFDVAPLPTKNVTVTQVNDNDVFALGSGFAAKAPNNLITSNNGAFITFINSAKANNITLGGGTILEATR